MLCCTLAGAGPHIGAVAVVAAAVRAEVAGIGTGCCHREAAGCIAVAGAEAGVGSMPVAGVVVLVVAGCRDQFGVAVLVDSLNRSVEWSTVKL